MNCAFVIHELDLFTKKQCGLPKRDLHHGEMELDGMADEVALAS